MQNLVLHVRFLSLGDVLTLGKNAIMRAAGDASMFAGNALEASAGSVLLDSQSSLVAHSKVVDLTAADHLSVSSSSSRTDATDVDIVVGQTLSTYAGVQHDTFAAALDVQTAGNASVAVGEQASVLLDSLLISARSGATLSAESLEVSTESDAVFSVDHAEVKLANLDVHASNSTAVVVDNIMSLVSAAVDISATTLSAGAVATMSLLATDVQISGADTIDVETSALTLSAAASATVFAGSTLNLESSDVAVHAYGAMRATTLDGSIGIEANGVGQAVTVGADEGGVEIRAKSAEHGSIRALAHDDVRIQAGASTNRTLCPSGASAGPAAGLLACPLYSDLACCSAADDVAIAVHMSLQVAPVFQEYPRCMDFMRHFVCGSQCAPDIGSFVPSELTGSGSTIQMCSSFCAGAFAACGEAELDGEYPTAVEFCGAFFQRLDANYNVSVVVVSSQPCFGGVGSIDASTSNGQIQLSAQGPDGSVAVYAEQTMTFHADAGAVEVSSGKSVSVQVMENTFWDGGAVTMVAGSTSGVAKTGGRVIVAAGHGLNVSDGAGGAVEINSGAGHGGAGGSMYLSSGVGMSGPGGNIELVVGSGNNGTGGSVLLTAGATADSNATGGTVTLTAGHGTSSGAGGGAVELVSGRGVDAASGALSLRTAESWNSGDSGLISIGSGNSVGRQSLRPQNSMSTAGSWATREPQ